MASTKVSCFVLMGLFGLALAVAPTPAAPAPGGATPAPGGNSTGSPNATLGGDLNCLSDADKEKVCSVQPSSNGSATPLCSAAGPADAQCSQIAAAVNGSSPCCVAVGVCSFQFNASTNASAPGNTTSAPGGATPAPGGATPAPGGASPAPGGASPAPYGAPAPGGASPAPGGASPAPGGASPAPGGASSGPVTPQPFTAYVSCGSVPSGFQQVKTCSSTKNIFVYPSAAGNSTTAPGGNATTPAY